MRPSYLYHRNSYTDKTAFYHWNGPLIRGKDTLLIAKRTVLSTSTFPNQRAIEENVKPDGGVGGKWVENVCFGDENVWRDNKTVKTTKVRIFARKRSENIMYRLLCTVDYSVNMKHHINDFSSTFSRRTRNSDPKESVVFSSQVILASISVYGYFITLGRPTSSWLSQMQMPRRHTGTRLSAATILFFTMTRVSHESIQCNQPFRGINEQSSTIEVGRLETTGGFVIGGFGLSHP